MVVSDGPPGVVTGTGVLATVRGRLRDAASHREWAVEANDGIIATAGLLQGFAGAGASTRVLLFTATAATSPAGSAPAAPTGPRRRPSATRSS